MQRDLVQALIFNHTRVVPVMRAAVVWSAAYEGCSRNGFEAREKLRASSCVTKRVDCVHLRVSCATRLKRQARRVHSSVTTC